MKRLGRHLIFAVILLGIQACYREYVLIPEHKSNEFNLLVSPNEEEKILESRDINFQISPDPFLYYGEVAYNVDHVKIRGQSATGYQRKSFAVNLSDYIIFPQFSTHKTYEKFKLLALCEDYTYIENRLSHLLLNEINLWPLQSFYTQLSINNNAQGLYLFVEDPEEYCFDVLGAEVILRRYYRGGIDEIEVNTEATSADTAIYARAFRSLYSDLLKYEGENLYNSLVKKLNLKQYMQKMAFDYLVKNGDYTDEVFFYGSVAHEGQVYFELIPWDYDDLFSRNPHEVGREWAVGTTFGKREYASKEAVDAVLDGRLVFSIEDDIDFAIATDSFLYEKYLEEMEVVLSKLTDDRIDKIFDQVYLEIEPFYLQEEVIEQSQFDADSTNMTILLYNIENKKKFIKNRIGTVR